MCSKSSSFPSIAHIICRLQVGILARRIKKMSGNSQRISLIKEQQKPIDSITQFHVDARKFIPEVSEIHLDAGDLGEEWDAPEDEDPDSTSGESAGAVPAMQHGPL